MDSDSDEPPGSHPFPTITKDFVASFVASAGLDPISLESKPLPEGRLLSVREVAERLNVSTALVYSLVEKGELAHVRVSNSIKFTTASIIAFIKEAKRRNE